MDGIMLVKSFEDTHQGQTHMVSHTWDLYRKPYSKGITHGPKSQVYKLVYNAELSEVGYRKYGS